MKLDAKTVASLTLSPGEKDRIFFDDQLPGFGYRLRLGASAKVRATWIAQYRRAGGTRRVLIGNANVIGAEAARAAAKKILAAVALGQDPQADRADRRTKDQQVLLVTTREIGDDGKPVRKGVIAEYLAAKKPDVRPRTYVEIERYLTSTYFRSLHSMPIDTIKRKDIATRLVAISNESGTVTASQARDMISAFFTWAMKAGIVDQNPVIGAVEPKSSQGRERVLSDAELAAVWRASGDNEYGKIVKLLILVGARRQEIGGMRWSEFDHDAGTWTLPKERAKNNRELTLSLPAIAWDIVNSVPRLANRDQLFGIHADDGYTDWGGGKRALDERLLGKIDEPFVVHDIRRSAATGMANLGVQPHIVEALLNHQSGHKAGIAGIYNKSSYSREVKAALALWADHVQALASGGERKVIPMVAVTKGQ
jgi:integrase